MRSILTNSPRRALHALRLAVLVLGVAAVGAGHAYAGEADDDETFEEKIIGNIMRGLGGTNMENTGIEYRERSPLVVPPKINLPPPAANASADPANWPKDPEIQRQKALKAARQKSKPDLVEAARPLSPRELASQRTAPDKSTIDSAKPGDPQMGSPLSPSQLGFDGWSIGKVFRGNTSESAEFKGEPARDSLTQPPSGYQTPSAAFAYGTGPKESLNKEFNPAAGKY